MAAQGVFYTRSMEVVRFLVLPCDTAPWQHPGLITGDRLVTSDHWAYVNSLVTWIPGSGYRMWHEHRKNEAGETVVRGHAGSTTSNFTNIYIAALVRQAFAQISHRHRPLRCSVSRLPLHPGVVRKPRDRRGGVGTTYHDNVSIDDVDPCDSKWIHKSFVITRSNEHKGVHLLMGGRTEKPKFLD